MRIARIFKDNDVINLGIGLPTLVGNYVPSDVEIILQSENGFLGLGPEPPAEAANPDLINAGAVPVTIVPGGCFFDSSISFGIIRGGHVDYTVLGVLEVDQAGNLANYKIPGKMVPGMGGAMDLLAGAKTVIAATLHFDKSGKSKMVQSCSLPLTAQGEVDIVVTDLGRFDITDGGFVLKEFFPPADPQWIVKHTQGTVLVDPQCKSFNL